VEVPDDVECSGFLLGEFSTGNDGVDVDGPLAGSGMFRIGVSRGPIAIQGGGEYAIEQNLSNYCSRPTSRWSVWERLQCFPRLEAFRQKERIQNGFPC
jgi:hypothetical protein